MPKVQAKSVASPKASAKKAVPVKAVPKKLPAKSSDALYPEVTVQVCQGDDSITDETAKKILGWREIPDESDMDYLLKDAEGKKIQCAHNLRNRQLYGSTVSTLAQEILRGRWRLNGENLIIGRKGTVLNGQHSLIAVIMACQLYDADPERYPFWNDQGKRPCIEKLVAFGIEESDDVVNTMDTCKPRSLSDVIFRSDYFVDVPMGERKNLARVLDYAVRLLWHRTGAGVDAYAPKRTHAESLDFINRHPRLLHCVKHISEEDQERGISKFISPGTAAGLMYLMATATSDAAEYMASESPKEDFLDFEMWDTAGEFWIMISSASSAVDPLKRAYAHMFEAEDGGSISEKMALIVKAWNAYIENKIITEKDLRLKYHTDEDGFRTLAECPVTGGIDVGNPVNKEDGDVSPEDIQREAAKIQAEKMEASKDSAKSAKKAAKKAGVKEPAPAKASSGGKTIDPKSFKDNEVLWATDPENGEKWRGTYVDHYSHSTGIVVKVKVAQGYAGAGRIFDVNIAALSRS